MQVDAMRRLAGALSILALSASATSAAPTVPAYDHVFLVIEENHTFGQIIRNPAAPFLNALAVTYGYANNYYGTGSPSAPNYVSMIGGDTFGIADDAPYYVRTQDAPNLIAQLDTARISWRAYFQGMPYAGYREECYPTRCNGVPDFDKYYASKHNGLIYFRSFQASSADMHRMVPFRELAGDLAANPPRFGYIVPDQCRDGHGSPPYCGDSGNPFDVNDNQLVRRTDALARTMVDEITTAPFWARGNNAIFIVWDSGNGTAGCCDANPGSGKVAAIVITSHGPRGVRDDTPYNHYSLLQTIELALGVPCTGFACDTAHVTPMANLLAVAGR